MPAIRSRNLIAIALVCAVVFTMTIPQLAAQTVAEKTSAVATETKGKIEDAGKAAGGKLEQLWRQIDEARLRHRTRDEMAAWVIMGLLVGGLLARASDFRRWTSFAFGMLGAFLGGIIARVTQLDLGLGPVLIRYEDLLFSMAGGVVILLIGRMFMARKAKKP